jgi:hypothetical protein
LKIPTLIIVAAKEELMDNKLHGERVYNLVKGNVPAKYEVFSGTHFEIYGKGRLQSIKMTYVSFVNSVNPAQFIDLSIYDMGTPTSAFGVFSAERSQGESPLALGRGGYRSDANYFIWQGQYYVRIISSEVKDELQRIGMDLAQKMTAFLTDSGEQVWGLAALPLKDRVSESVQYFKANAMGMEFMQNTFIAEYRKSGTKVTAFLSRRDSVESARGNLDRYATFAKKYGKGVDRLRVGGVKLVSCDMDGSYDVVFHNGCKPERSTDRLCGCILLDGRR